MFSFACQIFPNGRLAGLMYIIIKYKNIQNIKKMAEATSPGGGGVWCDTPAVNLEPPLARWHHCVLNKGGDSHPRASLS